MAQELGINTYPLKMCCCKYNPTALPISPFKSSPHMVVCPSAKISYLLSFNQSHWTLGLLLSIHKYKCVTLLKLVAIIYTPTKQRPIEMYFDQWISMGCIQLNCCISRSQCNYSYECGGLLLFLPKSSWECQLNPENRVGRGEEVVACFVGQTEMLMETEWSS